MLVDFEVGGRRTGLVTVDDALALARHIAGTEGAIYAGVQGYNGSFQREPDLAARRAEQERCTAPLAELCERLGAEGLPHRKLSPAAAPEPMPSMRPTASSPSARPAATSSWT